MMTFALILVSAIRQWEGTLLGLTANERFHAMSRLDNSESFMKSEWFTTTMLIVLAVSVIAFVGVSLYRKMSERRRTGKTAGVLTADGRGDHAETAEKKVISTSATSAVFAVNGAPSIENRVSNIESRLVGVEQRLTSIEQEVSSFEVVEDDSNVVHSAADTNPQGEEPK